MAYSTANPPWKLLGPVGRPSSTSVTPIVFSLWGYATTDALSTVAVSSYFSNGYELGLRRYDQVILMDINSTLTSIMTVTSVTTGAGATVSSLMTS